MSASPEFYNPSTAPAFSPPLLHATTAGAAEEYCCRTPTGAGIAFLQEPDTCPPAPRKPRAAPPSACKKRLFDVVTLRLDDLERIFRPSTPRDKRRRSPDNNTTSVRPAASATHDELISNPAASSSSSSGSNASFNQVLSSSC